jgi:hypothetical protein
LKKHFSSKFFAALAALFFLGAALKPTDTAPGFALPSLKGKTVALSNYAGMQSIVLVFYRGWAGYW